MKVFGIYKGNCEGWYLQELFMRKSSAIIRALELVELEKVETKEMQDYCKQNDPPGGTYYKDWEPSKHAPDRWDGDFEKSIAVEEIEVIEN